jgi:GNAT superfamily N-acetyltransferase
MTAVPLRIRTLGPADGELLDQVMDGMSDQSRYQRYHGPKPRLTSSDRRYLTNTDGHDHIALVAFAPDGAPVGIVRAVRLKEDPLTAELGVEVVDAWQNRGVGTTLIARVAGRAAAEGIERLVARVLDESGFGRSLLRRGWNAVGRDGPSMILGADSWALARSARVVVRAAPPEHLAG